MRCGAVERVESVPAAVWSLPGSLGGSHTGDYVDGACYHNSSFATTSRRKPIIANVLR